MKKNLLAAAGIVIVFSWVLIIFGHNRPQPSAARPSAVKILNVVAAENFWGSLVAQIGGSRVHVLSIVSDPNADPHEYESNAGTARAVALADYVVLNGAGYDSWMNKLLSAGGSPARRVLTVAALLGKKSGANPHFWYNPEYVNLAAGKMEQDLAALDPAGAGYYKKQYQTLEAALAGYRNRIALIKQRFGGTRVASTESIFVYLAAAAGLDLISPAAFMDAVAGGSEPSPRSIIEFQNQLKRRQPAVLVYNRQTVTPLTEGMKQLAAAEGIPVSGITETIQPPAVPFQDWMNVELTSLQNALNAGIHDKQRR